MLQGMVVLGSKCNKCDPTLLKKAFHDSAQPSGLPLKATRLTVFSSRSMPTGLAIFTM